MVLTFAAPAVPRNAALRSRQDRHLTVKKSGRVSAAAFLVKMNWD